MTLCHRTCVDMIYSAPDTASVSLWSAAESEGVPAACITTTSEQTVWFGAAGPGMGLLPLSGPGPDHYAYGSQNPCDPEPPALITPSDYGVITPGILISSLSLASTP